MSERNRVICPPCIVKLLLPQAEASIPAPRAAEGMPAEQELLQGVRGLVPPLTREWLLTVRAGTDATPAAGMGHDSGKGR